MVNAACDASVHFTPTKVSQADCTLGTAPGVFIASTYSCTRAARPEKRKLGISKIIAKRLIRAKSRYFLSFCFVFNLSPRQLNLQKIMVQLCYSRPLIFRHWNCFLSSVPKDGKDGHGLKLENVGSGFSTLNDMPAKISVPVPWWNSFGISLITLQQQIFVWVKALSNISTDLTWKQQYPSSVIVPLSQDTTWLKIVPCNFWNFPE